MVPSTSARARCTVTLSALFSLLCIVYDGALAQTLAVPGTSVTLEPPPGFALASAFTGLVRSEDNSSILITELPAQAHAELFALFADRDAARADFASRGVAIKDAVTVEGSATNAPMLVGHQAIPQGRVTKYLALFEGEVTVLLTASVFDPSALTPEMAATLVRSVAVGQAPNQGELLAQLPFTFRAAPPFRVGDVLGGHSVSLVTGGSAAPAGSGPIMVIARALSPLPETEISTQTAIAIARATQGFETLEVTATKEISFAGLSGIRVEGTVGEQMLMQVLATPADGLYIRLIALGSRQSLQRLRVAIDAVVRSVQMRP